MSGGSQHNPNGRQSQLGAGWSPLQLQVANFLRGAPQAHMASREGVTWHTPTPPPHLYHVPAPSPPDPLQAIKSTSSNSVFRHTTTPPELYRHTPTPPDKHLMRHTPSPGDVKTAPTIPQVELYPHLGSGREKIVRPDEMLYARGGVDLSLGGARGANGAAPSHSPAVSPAPALSVRDAPTINSLIARSRHPHTKFDAILERLVPSPHSVIMHSRTAPTPSPPSSNEDSTDSGGALQGSKRKRKPERTLRVPCVPNMQTTSLAPTLPTANEVSKPSRPPEEEPSRTSPPKEKVSPIENGEALYTKQNGPEKKKEIPSSPQPLEPHTRRKTRSDSAETIDEIAAMIANTDRKEESLEMTEKTPESEQEPPVTIDKLKSVLASPEAIRAEPPKVEEIPAVQISHPKEQEPLVAPPTTEAIASTAVEAITVPRRSSSRLSNSESANVPIETSLKDKPTELEVTEEKKSAPPTEVCFVEVENQLEKMFAGIEEEPLNDESEKKENKNKINVEDGQHISPPKKRRKSTSKSETKPSRRSSRAAIVEEPLKKKPVGKKSENRGKGKKTKDSTAKDAYDSGSNASSSRSRGPYIQIRGPRNSPLSVSVINASTGEDEAEGIPLRRKGEEFRNGLRARGLHASTLGLRYDATTPDATWLCVFCLRRPHALGLGDLFGPYTIDNECDEYRSADESTQQRYETGPSEVWFHASCAVWAPGLIAAGARVWGLNRAVWVSRQTRCSHCAKHSASLACITRGCRARAHLPCATIHHWLLLEDRFQAYCARHANIHEQAVP